MQSTIAPIPTYITIRELSQLTTYGVDHLRRLAQNGELGQVVRRSPRAKVLLPRAAALARLGIQAEDAGVAG